MYAQGFIKVASASPTVRVGDPIYNIKEIIKILKEDDNKSSFMVFPELAVTGYSAGDLFYQDYLYLESQKAIKYLLKNNPYQGVIVLGSIYKDNDIIYNCSFVIQDDEILGIVPKSFLPYTYEFSEIRWFNSGLNIKQDKTKVIFLDKEVPFGNIIFTSKDMKVNFGVEVCADLWAPVSPHQELYSNGAIMIFNNSASSDSLGKDEVRRLLVKAASYKFNGAYVYSSTSAFESTSEVVFSGHKIIASNGEIVSEANSLTDKEEIIYGDIDISHLHFLRQNNSWFKDTADILRSSDFTMVKYCLKQEKDFTFDNDFDIYPFKLRSYEDFNRVIMIQAASLFKRLDYIKTTKTVIGVSGGLDSTIALLSLVYTYDKYNLDRKDIIGLSLPSENTSLESKELALNLMKKLNITSFEIDITEDVKRGLNNINHDGKTKDTTYENIQARLRTNILMNMANLHHGIVIGTSDMSEIALGWSTFNGDQMAMYGLNSGLPKTMIQDMMNYYGDLYPEVDMLLMQILNRPISPELTSQTQRTEDYIGKYEINDFIMYRFLSMGDSPERIKYLLVKFFSLTTEEADKYINRFFNRFFKNQFKRLTMPEGVKVLNLSLSPRSQVKLSGDTYFINNE